MNALEPIDIRTGRPFEGRRAHLYRPAIDGESIEGGLGRARGLLGGAFMGVMLAQQGGGSILPDGYTQLKSVYGSGAGQQVGTGVYISQDFGFEIICNFARFRSEQTGGRFLNIWRSDGAIGFVHRNTQCSYIWGTTTQTYVTYPSATDDYRISFNFLMDNKIHFDGASQDTTLRSVSAFSSTYATFRLFTCVDGNYADKYPYKMEIYRFRASSGSDIIRDMIPAKRDSDGAVGFYDLIGDEFMGNIGTGTLVGTPL